MGTTRGIQRNIEKQIDAFLKENEHVLKRGWQNEPFHRKSELANLLKNGITPQDLDRAFLRGRQEAYEATAPAVQKVVYAAVMLVLSERGIGSDECFDIIHDVDEKVVTTISSDDIAQETLDKLGIRFLSENGVERLQRVEK